MPRSRYTVTCMMMVDGMPAHGVRVVIAGIRQMVMPMIGGAAHMVQHGSGERIWRMFYLKGVISLIEDCRARLRR